MKITGSLAVMRDMWPSRLTTEGLHTLYALTPHGTVAKAWPRGDIIWIFDPPPTVDEFLTQYPSALLVTEIES